MGILNCIKINQSSSNPYGVKVFVVKMVKIGIVIHSFWGKLYHHVKIGKKTAILLAVLDYFGRYCIILGSLP